MDRPDIPLNALRTLEVAMRQGSFTRAAQELRVTQAAVSHQIARLEDLLGVTLFLRTPQGLVPTDEGRMLFPVLEHSFESIARSLDRLAGNRDTEVLNLGVNTSFAMGWLLPRLDQFRTAHPQIDLRIATNNNRVEILREGLDMSIRFGTGGWSAHEVQPLMTVAFSPLCAPVLAQRLHQPSDLGQMPLLRSFRAAEWSHWFEAAQIPCPPQHGPVFDSSLALAELAAAGEGVALLPKSMFLRYLQDGRLLQPFPLEVELGQYYLAWPSERAVSAAMRDFADWIAQECTQVPNGIGKS